MSDPETTPDPPFAMDRPETREPVVHAINLGSSEMFEKIAAVRALQPEAGAPHASIAAILDALEMMAKTVAMLEITLVGK